MTASYPISVKSFTTKVDGVTDVLASHMNDVQAEIAAIETDLIGVPWADYGATSTIVGWGSFATKQIYYRKPVDKLVFVKFYLDGTSDSTSLHFTLPYTCNADIPTYFICAGRDNNAWQTLPAFGLINANSATCSVYKTITATGWTASQTKSIVGQFFYWIA
jgi:hypothetical protein